MLKTVKTAIVDEIHAVAGSKRGSHLALSLERLDALTGKRPVRIGLSATQKPIREIARFLVGGDGYLSDTNRSAPRCTIVDEGYRRHLDLGIEIPGTPLSAVCSNETWEEIYDRLAELIGKERTTLVFVNTRRLAERLTFHLSKRLGDENVASHHGSLSREHRLQAEQRLKAGEVKALVATASLELGIDIGDGGPGLPDRVYALHRHPSTAGRPVRALAGGYTQRAALRPDPRRPGGMCGAALPGASRQPGPAVHA